jgi:hypothetical protein
VRVGNPIINGYIKRQTAETRGWTDRRVRESDMERRNDGGHVPRLNLYPLIFSLTKTYSQDDHRRH